MRFTLIAVDDDFNHVESRFESFMLDDTVERIESFLLGCGYKFDGSVKIVEDAPISSST